MTEWDEIPDSIRPQWWTGQDPLNGLIAEYADLMRNVDPSLKDGLRIESVTKYGAMVQVSTDTLMDEGLIPDTRPPVARHAPGYPLRWRIREAVAAARLRLGTWIAGVDLADRDDEDDW